MEHNKDIVFEISGLISKSLSGEITKEERMRLDVWREESKDHQILFDGICSDLMMREKIKQYKEVDVQLAFSLFVSKRKKQCLRQHWIRMISRYAAILVLPLLMVLFYIAREDAGNELVQHQENEVEIQKNVPVLTLSNGREVALADQDLLLQEGNGVQIAMKSKDGMQYRSSDSIGSELIYNTLKTPSQCDFSFTLADGTKVWLNAKSSLRYPVAFTGKERIVYAEGEVYLEVAKDRKRPFFVVLDGMKVEVLGTSFNVNSYADEDYAEVTLVEGHIVAHVIDKCYNLVPNQQLRLNKGKQTVDVRTVNVCDYTSWKEGQYIFKGRTLAEVAKVLERWYDVEIIFEEESCKESIYTGVINKEERIDAFVQRLNEISLFRCRVDGMKVYIK